MARDLQSGEITQLEAAANRPAFFFEGIFGATTLRLCTLGRNVTFGGNTFLGNGHIQTIKPAAEVDNIRAVGISIELSFLPPTVVSLILSNSKAAGTGKLWLCMMSSTWGVTPNGYQLFAGKIDSSDVQYAGAGARVEIRYESRLGRAAAQKRKPLQRPKPAAFLSDRRGLAVCGAGFAVVRLLGARHEQIEPAAAR